MPVFRPPPRGAATMSRMAPFVGGVLVPALRRYLDDGMVDRAPTLAYYGIFSLFPMLLLAFSLVRLVGGDSAPDDLSRYAAEHGAGGAVRDVLRSAAETARDAPAPTAGAAGTIGLLSVVYGASRTFTAAGRALDVVHRRGSVNRSIARRAQDLGWTLVLLVGAVAAAVLASVSGRLLEDLLGLVGLSGAAVTVWSVVRLPIAAALALLLVAVVAWAAPTVRRDRFRLATAGSVATVGIIALETAGLSFYVAEIATYNTTYGAFAGAVILLLWIWLAGSAFLFGAELDAVLEERRRPKRVMAPEPARATVSS